MKRFFALFACALLASVAVPAGAAEPPAPFVFTGTVMLNGAPASGYEVTLYQGNGNDADFLKTRKTIASSSTDDGGEFVIIAPQQPLTAGVLTLRAKGFQTIDGKVQVFGGQILVQDANTTPTTGLSIVAGPVADANYGIRNNRYANKTIFFMTDRPARAGGGFDTTSTDFTPSYGVFNGHVALGPAALPSGTCSAATQWTCPPAPRRGEDAYIDGISTTGQGTDGLTKFIADVAKTFPAGRRARVLVYVHGYNNDFSGAGATAAQVAYESGQQADAVILYSWPSAHRFSKYASDFKNVGISVNKNLIPFLQQLATLSDRADIHLVAHSMGTHAVTTALSGFTLATPAFASLSMFAGDTDILVFTPAIPTLLKNAKQVRVYSNGGDHVLRIAQCYAGDNRPRIGQTPQSFAAPIRWYDATAFAPHAGLGHGYITNSFEVASDYNAQVTGTPIAAARSSLRGLPWLGGVESSWSIDWGPLAASATCGILTKLP